MRNKLEWLNYNNFVYKGVMFIPSEYGRILSESNWIRIDSVIKDML